MEIIVCIKQVLDPDLPPAKFAIDSRMNRAIQPDGMPLVISPYDALAVEAALRIKENNTANITVLTVGDTSADVVVKKALAMGADKAVIISDEAFNESDGFATASILAKAIEKIGQYDLILCGRQAADWDVGMVGLVLAENLNVPVVTRAKEIRIRDGEVEVQRLTAGGYETYGGTLPMVVTVSSELGQARIPSGMGIIKAARQEIPVWSSADLAIDPSMAGASSARNSLVKLYVPSYERKCEMIEKEDVAEAAALLAERIAAIIQ
ncbi:MAG: electron transfer flavoprotein subunit beta/FixA family protein [Deltaproteobacteria bacterium]|nr:electron transfer flavoprotein subunit beta/FixA family protein [Deltaproteobacteria bacterium]